MSGAAKQGKKGVDKKVRKQGIFVRINNLFTEYNKILIVNADNVGSSHMQQIRLALRKNDATFLMGKNTMIRTSLRKLIVNNPQLESLLPVIKGNVGFIFTKGDVSALKKLADENKVEAPARAGAIAPCDVIVPAGSTGLEPTKTSFFQALQIATRITKGTIEIINDVKIIVTGQKVGPSEAALLQMLNIKPFKYGLVPKYVYESGSVFESAALDLSPDEILSKFRDGVQTVAAVSLGANYPTVVSVPHSLISGFKKVLAVSLATDYTFKQSEEIKNNLALQSVYNGLNDGFKKVLAIGLATKYSFKQVDEVKAYLANPTAFAEEGCKKEEPKKEEKGGKKEEKGGKKEEPKKEEKKEEEEDGDMGLGLFD